ncbi:hypothetical protein TNCV_914511 [Trichonephila clavipes]|nr:hypothetical protein TNCV_914511 [Trichonephila clavipes]
MQKRSTVPKGRIIGLGAKGRSISVMAKFVNRSRAVVKVYRAWQNGTVQNQQRGKWGAPQTIDKKVNDGCRNTLGRPLSN